MSFDVVFSPTARRDLNSIPPRIVPAIIAFIFGDLTASPRRVGKPLQCELGGTYTARRGPYRVLYDIEDEPPQVVILHIDHRADDYRSQ